MQMMTVQNQEVRRQHVVAPSLGSQPAVQFDTDAEGKAQVPVTCPIHLVPGWNVVDGTPAEVVQVEGEVRAPDGPLVLWQAPPQAIRKDRPVAGQQVTCPSGLACLMDAQGRFAAPENCGLAEVPGFQNLGAYDGTVPLPVAAQTPTAAEADPNYGMVLPGDLEEDEHILDEEEAPAPAAPRPPRQGRRAKKGDDEG